MAVDPKKLSAFVKGGKHSFPPKKKGDKGADGDDDKEKDDDGDDDDGEEDEDDGSSDNAGKDGDDDAGSDGGSDDGDDSGDHHDADDHSHSDADDDSDGDGAGDADVDVESVASDIKEGKGDKRLMKLTKRMLGGADKPKKNPPQWAKNEDVWEKAKEAVGIDDEGHSDKYDDPWAVVTHVYEKMGGEIG